MTIENINDCTTLRISDDLIDAFIAQSPTFDHSLRITYQLNCGTATVVTLEDTSGLNTTDSSYDISSPSTGVYSVKIEKVPDSGADITDDFNCFFIDCSKVDCDVINFTADDLSSNVVKYYQALTYAYGCDEYPCNAACRIYNHLNNILGNTSDCGCN